MTDQNKCYSQWNDCPYQDEFLCGLWRSEDTRLSIHPDNATSLEDQRAMREAKFTKEYCQNPDKPDLIIKDRS